MIILALRTDKPEAEIGLFDDHKELVYKKWLAHRQLADTIHNKMEEILNQSSIELGDIEGIVVFKGPGSFTSLRIGITVANALSYARQIPVVAKDGQDWLAHGIKDLLAGKNDKIAVPEYGAPANVTKPRK